MLQYCDVKVQITIRHVAQPRFHFLPLEGAAREQEGQAQSEEKISAYHIIG